MSGLIPMQYIEEKCRNIVSIPLYFSLFMLVTIIFTLIFYIQTKNEILPAIILSILWIYFWKISEIEGKTFLIVASVFGYVHELLGVQYGYFTYLNGVFGDVPIWILPGYGTIFWSAFNLSNIFEKQYSRVKWFRFTDYFIIASFFALVVFDLLYFDLSRSPVSIGLKFVVMFMLFSTFHMLRLAYLTGFFTVLTETLGETLGAWQHPDFSLLSLMAGYVFLLWICLSISEVRTKHKTQDHQNFLAGTITTLVGFVNGSKQWTKKEATAAVLLTSFYTLSLLGMVSV